MGHNIDLEDMLNLPHETVCPVCGEKQLSFYDEYDIDCGEPFSKGEWILDNTCVECEHKWTYRFKVKIEETG